MTKTLLFVGEPNSAHIAMLNLIKSEKKPHITLNIPDSTNLRTYVENVDLDSQIHIIPKNGGST